MATSLIHLAIPLLLLLLLTKKELHKYVLLLSPIAVLPDTDTFFILHRALLHNFFIPLFLLCSAFYFTKYKEPLLISAFYVGSHILLDIFDGGVVGLYPFYDGMMFVNAGLSSNSTDVLIWNFTYGFDKTYGEGYKTAVGYICDSVNFGIIVFVLLIAIIRKVSK